VPLVSVSSFEPLELQPCTLSLTTIYQLKPVVVSILSSPIIHYACSSYIEPSTRTCWLLSYDLIHHDIPKN
jgi:hypothetical protein